MMWEHVIMIQEVANLTSVQIEISALLHIMRITHVWIMKSAGPRHRLSRGTRSIARILSPEVDRNIMAVIEPEALGPI